MSTDGHYLKNELYSLIKTDPAVFEFLQKGSLDGIWYWDLEKPENEWMSPQFWETLGYDPQEKKHLASEWQDLIHEDDLPTAIDNFQKHCDDPHHPYDQIVRYRHKNGSTVWVRCRGIAIRNDRGKPVRMLGAHNELTQQKRAEEEARKNEERYRYHFLHFPVPIFVWKHQHKSFVLSDYNQAAETITGGKIAELTGVTSDQLYNDEHSSHLNDTLLDCFHKKQTIHKEFEYTLKTTGEVKWINGTWVFVSPDTVMLHTDDITDRRKAEESLRQSEKKYRKLYEDAAIGIFHSTFDGRFLDVNPALAKMLGYETPQDVVESIDDIAKQVYADPPTRDDVVARSLANGETVKVENIYRRKDGSLWNAFLYLRYVADESGQPVYLEGFVEDITERKHVEESLQESKTFLENINDIAYSADTKGNVLWANRATEKVTGRPLTEIVDKPFLPLFMETDHGSLKDAYRRALQGESLEQTFTFTSGVTCHFTILPKRNHRGDIVGVFGVARDITEAKRAEKILHKSNEMLKRTEAMANIGSWEWDVRTDRAQWSEELFRIFGQDPAEEAPAFAEQTELYAKGDIQRLQDAVEACVQNGKSYEIELRAVRSDGEIRHCVSRGQPQYDEHGKVIRLSGSFQDITERKRDEEERAYLAGQLRQAQKMEAVGRLAGGVAHDFNNMLGVIIGHADMALEDLAPSQSIYSILKEIKRAGERSANLTRQLLAFARKQTVAPKVLDLNETLANMTSMLHRLIGEDIDLAWLPGENVWPVRVDPSQIDQILANLCVNARDAIADVGKITIETGNAVFNEEYCREHPGFKPGDYVLLAVSDDGCGMDSEIRENIFEPFFTTKNAGKGTGLGLATVYGVVKQNDGFINCYSEPGQGSTFKIYLPRYRSKAKALVEKSENIQTKPGSETILLVEDEIAILEMTAQMLNRLGYQVIPARTPGEAIRLAQEHAGDIHLLVTDVVMPEMNGRDLAKNILSMYPNLKRLFMSGYTANVIAHRGILDEGIHFIQKPFSRKQLGVKVRAVLDGDDSLPNA